MGSYNQRRFSTFRETRSCKEVHAQRKRTSKNCNDQKYGPWQPASVSDIHAPIKRKEHRQRKRTYKQFDDQKYDQHVSVNNIHAPMKSKEPSSIELQNKNLKMLKTKFMGNSKPKLAYTHSSLYC